MNWRLLGAHDGPGKDDQTRRPNWSINRSKDCESRTLPGAKKRLGRRQDVAPRLDSWRLAHPLMVPFDYFPRARKQKTSVSKWWPPGEPVGGRMASRSHRRILIA